MVYQQDIERLMAEMQRVQNKGFGLIDEAEAVVENGGDPTQGQRLGTKQAEFQEELEQLLVDVQAVAERSGTVARRPNYEPSRDAFNAAYDKKEDEFTITYNGSVDVAVNDLTVELDGSPVSPFNGPATSGTTVTVDASGVSEPAQLTVEWTATSSGAGNSLPSASSSPVDVSGVGKNPTLTKNTRTYTERAQKGGGG